MHIQSTPNGYFKSSLQDMLIISAGWILTVLLTNPLGNFPLNDDWSYAIAVQRLMETGSYTPTAWTSMSLVSQVLWGILFSSLFGLTFEVLRFSTLTLSIIGVLSLYLLVRAISQNRTIALLTALTVAFSPLYFALSYTFMTDVPFTALCILSLLFLSRHLQSGSRSALLAGSFFATAAILCRQNGLYIPLAFLLTVVWSSRGKLSSVLKGLLPLTIGLGALLLYQHYLSVSGKMPELYGMQVQELFSMLSGGHFLSQPVGRYTFFALMYLGLFLSPILIYLLFCYPKLWKSWWFMISLAFFAVLLLVMAVYTGRLMPYGYNVLVKAGIGPLSLYDSLVLENAPIAKIPEVIWGLATALGMMGGALLLSFFTYMLGNIICKKKAHKQAEGNGLTLFFISCALIYLCPLLLLGFFDRYLIPLLVLLPLALFSYFREENRERKRPCYKAQAISYLLLAGFGLFSIAATHDYLSWNRARWQALQDLTHRRQIPASEIDGGFEFNGLHHFHSHESSPKGAELHEWWGKPKPAYLITFGAIPNFTVENRYVYRRWIPPFTGEILVLKRQLPQP